MSIHHFTKNATPKFIFCLKKGTPKNDKDDATGCKMISLLIVASTFRHDLSFFHERGRNVVYFWYFQKDGAELCERFQFIEAEYGDKVIDYFHSNFFKNSSHENLKISCN